MVEIADGKMPRNNPRYTKTKQTWVLDYTAGYYGMHIDVIMTVLSRQQC